MGEASRKKRERRAGPASRDDADSPLTPLVRELREALVAQARAVVEASPTDAPRARVEAAARSIQALIETEDDVDGEALDAVGPDADRTTKAFASAVASLSAMRFGALDTELPTDIEADIREAAQEAAEELIAFEGLALGTRLSAILNDTDARTFAAAAICVLGPSWDPLAEDPLNEDDLGALVAGLAAARATLAMLGAAEGRDVDGIRQSIDTAGVAIRNTTVEERDLLADGNTAVAWNVAHALIAGFDVASMPAVRVVGGQIPSIFAAGAIGRGWLDGTDVADGFDENVDELEQTLERVPKEDLRKAIADDPLLAAYVAGRSWRLAPLTGWKLPWESKPRSLGADASGTTDTAGRTADERPEPRSSR